MQKPLFSNDFVKTSKMFDNIFSIGKNYDFIGTERIFAGHRAKLYYIDSFIESELLDRIFVYLQKLEKIKGIDNVTDFLKESLPHTEIKAEYDAEKFIYAVMSGTVGMIMDSLDFVGIIIDIRNYPTRSIDESDNDRVLRGSHDSFVETIKKNSTLIRRRIRTPNLRFEKFVVGESSGTDVVIAYIEGEADKDFVNQLKNKISNIKINALTFGQQSLAECLVKRGWYDPFPKFRFTERPDAAAAQLLEGSVIILCDTSPEAIILPTCLLDFMQETDDYYFPPLTGSYLRILRYFVFFLTLFLTPTWYLLITNQSLIPSWLNFILVDTECNMPIILQLFIIEFALDGLKLASLNTPSSLNNTFGVVGGLILGDFAVQIGWFVPEVIVYMAFVAIAGFSQSSYELGYTFKFMRMMLLALTAIFGIIGYAIGVFLIILFILLSKTANGKRSYLYPIIPFNKRALKRLIIRDKLTR